MTKYYLGAAVVILAGCSGKGLDTNSVRFSSSLSVVNEAGEAIECKSEAQIQASGGDYACLFAQADYQGSACCFAKPATRALYRIPSATAVAVGTGSVKISSPFSYYVCGTEFTTLAEFDGAIAGGSTQSPTAFSYTHADQSLSSYAKSNEVFFGIRTLIFD